MATKNLGVSRNVKPEEALVRPDQVHCNICNTDVQEYAWSDHKESNAHRRKEAFSVYRTAFEEAERDKNGVTVSHGGTTLDFGVVDPTNAKQGIQLCLIVRSAVPSAKITIKEVKLASRSLRTPFRVDIQGPSSFLQYGVDLVIGVKAVSSLVGRHDDRVQIIFEDATLQKEFVIVRSVRIIIGNQVDHELLRPKNVYVPRKRIAQSLEGNIIPGESPPALRSIRYIVELPHAHVPERVSSALGHGSKINISDAFGGSLLPAAFNASTHALHYKTLLWAEEFRMIRDLQTYDITNATLNNYNHYYYLAVTGLSEKRPNVLVGDKILVQKHDAAPGEWFEGYVHFVRKEDIGLCFNSVFENQFSPEMLFNVRFKLNRRPLRIQHQALDTTFRPDRVLFPDPSHVSDDHPVSVEALRPLVFNRLVVDNPAQLLAITKIVNQTPGSIPFIIFGPPGTGKTVTVVGSIRQLLQHNPKARILACAPSNSAADLIALRLRMLGTDNLYRFYTPFKVKNTVPPELLSYARTNSDGYFTVPPMATLEKFQVVVSTCVSASFAHDLGMPRGHFTHVFVDEAGQATEPEVLAAINTIADNNTNVIPSGDPKQLGPVVRSPIAREFGLEKSLLERLMEREVYTKAQAHPPIVKLTQNFRSHPNILSFPNDAFYKGDLHACGNSQITNAYLGSSLLPNETFPIVFRAVSGRDDREALSPSFFNVYEALQVKSMIELLRQDRRFRTTDADIGVITPYHAQVCKIRAILRGSADEVKVDSVEEFQGQERGVIIISTVRSSKDFVKYDLQHMLGFLANPRRFNVAVTRAKSLLIVIGDPTILSLDPLWRRFMNFVYKNGGWEGEPPRWDTGASVDFPADLVGEIRHSAAADMDDLARQMEGMTMGLLEDDDGVDESEDDSNVDRPWLNETDVSLIH